MSVAELNTSIARVREIGGERVHGTELEVDLKFVFRSSAYASGLREVAAERRGSQVALIGFVPSYYLKQIAQHLAVEEFGEHKLLNEIEVRTQARRKDWTGGESWPQRREL